MRDMDKRGELVSRILTLAICFIAVSVLVVVGTVLAPKKPPLVTMGGPTSYASFDPPHPEWGVDDDSSGKFEELALGVRIASTAAQSTAMTACMFYASGIDNYGDLNNTTAIFYKGPCVTIVDTLDIGLNNWTVDFSRYDLYNWNRTGTWTVMLDLYDESTGMKLDDDTHTTASYSQSDFDIPPATLSDTYSDYTVDEDNDTKADKLIVNVTLDVNVAGSYSVVGFIHNNSEDEMMDNDTIGLASYSVGSHSLALEFDVTSYQSYSGPFLISTRVAADGEEYYDEDVYWTTTTSLG